MNKRLRYLWGAAGLAFLATFAACGDDDDGDGNGPVDNPPTVELSAPAAGVAYAPGSDLTIEWTATDDGTVTVDLTYTADGVAETSIASDQTGSSFDWTLPNENLFGVAIKAVATDDAAQTDEDETDIFAIVPTSARNFVTSAVCQECHQGKYDDLFNSGHPYKLNKVEGGVAPTIPNSPGVPNPPTGYTWNDITYMIGGYGWKARFMNSDGYILVTGLEGVPTQYNLPDQPRTGLPAEWVDYHASDTEPKPYTCGDCHTTGWLDFTDNGGVNQDGLEGILGTWEETGIRCEECHGPGGDHVAQQSAAAITVDPEAELCGNCHFRDTNHNILAKGGFIRHHEQYDELINGGKSTFDCSSCHEPHIGVRYGNAAAGGIVQSCEDCHTGVNLNHLPIDCEGCHMARASKSARAVHLYEGDVRTHIFTINADPVNKDEMFFVDPGSGNTHTRGFVTLDFACYGCHAEADEVTGDPTGEGGTGSARKLSELSTRAMGIHQ